MLIKVIDLLQHPNIGTLSSSNIIKKYSFAKNLSIFTLTKMHIHLY